VEEFRRPNDEERRQILNLDCAGLGLHSSVIDEIVKLTGPQGQHKLGYTFSDIRTRLLPEALAQAYPSRKINQSDLIDAIARVAPSPAVDNVEDHR
jgi:AAA+ superfamily predicted ATPase